MKGIISPGVWIYKFGIVYKFTIRKKLTELVQEKRMVCFCFPRLVVARYPVKYNGDYP